MHLPSAGAQECQQLIKPATQAGVRGLRFAILQLEEELIELQLIENGVAVRVDEPQAGGGWLLVFWRKQLREEAGIV